jgi:hypothetical protein
MRLEPASFEATEPQQMRSPAVLMLMWTILASTCTVGQRPQGLAASQLLQSAGLSLSWRQQRQLWL